MGNTKLYLPHNCPDYRGTSVRPLQFPLLGLDMATS
jgi:hypothetical protein